MGRDSGHNQELFEMKSDVNKNGNPGGRDRLRKTPKHLQRDLVDIP